MRIEQKLATFIDSKGRRRLTWSLAPRRLISMIPYGCGSGKTGYLVVDVCERVAVVAPRGCDKNRVLEALKLHFTVVTVSS